MMYKRLLMRRKKNVTNIYITTGVIKTYISTKKLEKNVKKAMSETRDQAYTAVLKIRYERGRK
jgi:hypothetical protein